MTPDALKQSAIEIWGGRGWIAALSQALGVDRSQVWRYVTARTQIPGPVAAAMTCWLCKFRATGERP